MSNNEFKFDYINLNFTDQGEQCIVTIDYSPDLPEGITNEDMLKSTQPCVKLVSILLHNLDEMQKAKETYETLMELAVEEGKAEAEQKEQSSEPLETFPGMRKLR